MDAKTHLAYDFPLSVVMIAMSAFIIRALCADRRQSGS